MIAIMDNNYRYSYYKSYHLIVVTDSYSMLCLLTLHQLVNYINQR